MSDCREIVIDTETTGLNPNTGDRIVEIGCVEIVNKVRTGQFFHAFVNPEREVPQEAFRIHGISTEFLKDKPLFKHITKEFLAFIANSNIIIHNAAFDLGFINKELNYTGHMPIQAGRVTDTLLIARRRFPGSPASLDALCRKFNVSLETRGKHGALIDAELLAQVYLQLTGNSQGAMNFANSNVEEKITYNRKNRPARPTEPLEPLVAQHIEFINKKLKNSIWTKSAS
jgi:DNA polymerase-3 subunit epsilon